MKIMGRGKSTEQASHAILDSHIYQFAVRTSRKRKRFGETFCPAGEIKIKYALTPGEKDHSVKRVSGKVLNMNENFVLIQTENYKECFRVNDFYSGRVQLVP